MQRGESVAEGVADEFAEGEDGGVDDFVGDAGSGAAPRDEARGVQDGEVFGGVLLTQAHPLRQLADSCWADAEGVQQFDPCRLAQDPEPFGDKLDQGLGQRSGNSHHPTLLLTTAELYSCE